MNDFSGILTPAAACTGVHLLVADGTKTYAGVDLKDYVGTVKALTTLNQESGAATVVVSWLDSADNSTFATFAGAPTPLTLTQTNLLTYSTIDTRNCKRYVQVKYLTASTTATFNLATVLVGTKNVAG